MCKKETEHRKNPNFKFGHNMGSYWPNVDHSRAKMHRFFALSPVLTPKNIVSYPKWHHIRVIKLENFTTLKVLSNLPDGCPKLV